MQAFHPRLADLPTEIAVFPLTGALLLPRGRLPLNIFEPRYLAMTMDALGQGRLFGMVQPDARGKAAQGLYRIGCLGRISSFSETDDGRLLITLIGVARFRIVEELPLAPGGYRRVRADYTDFVTDLLEAEPPPLDRPALLGALKPYFLARGIEANWDAVEQTPDALLVTMLAMVCPFDPPEKQALLEAAEGSDRADMLVTLLRMGAAANMPNPGSLS
jgi:Lon protease-like protein